MSDVSPIDLTKLRIDRAEDRPAPLRRRGRRWSLTPLIALATLAGLVWVLWPRIEPMVARWRAPEVRAGIVIITRPGADLELTTASGYVVPRTKAALAAKVAGTLTHLLVDVGDAVVDKQLIAQIERVDWENRKAQQEAELKRAEAASALAAHRVLQAEGVVARIAVEETELTSALAESAATLKEAERILERDQNLLASGAGIRDDVDRARNELTRARAATARAEQSRSVLQARKAEAVLAVTEAEFLQKQTAVGVTRALADLAAAETDLLHTEIRAPFAGTILRKEAEVGEIVVPALAGGSTSRGSVVTMADFATLELEVDVFERDIRLVTDKGPTEVRINALPDLVLKGRVRQIVPTADRTKGTVQVKVELLEHDPRVLPEMAGKVVFLRDAPAIKKPSAVLAPTSALVRGKDQPGVFLIEGDRLRFRAVTTGVTEGDRTVITQGLSGGEQVVLDPQASLTDRMLVRILEQDGD